MKNTTRDENLQRFARTVYGAGPAVAATVAAASRTASSAFDGRAVAHEIMLRADAGGTSHVAQMAVVHPVERQHAPLFVGLNFRGNHTMSSDPAIGLPSDDAAPIAYDAHTEAPPSRGALSGRWPLELIVRRGFGVATVCYLQLGPDSESLRTRGLLPMLSPGPDESWGGLGLWAWYLQQMRSVLLAEDLGGRHIAFGHSRLGKAALWAAAQDTGFDGVVSNDSGCMGASLSLSQGAETPELLARVRPYWFTGELVRQLAAGAPLPTQDQLLAAIAPRALYVASAADDVGADPEGERAAVEAARRANPDAPIGYHCRPGGHDVTADDWVRFLDFFSTAHGRSVTA